ncbi:MAG: helix-turn-helix domain-containing protein, partial [Candidatus Omnitrophica bacterium]|nr:helix-turn-helix domain-containing protein [Candidatus Omnitrophota bacterium]
MDNETIDSYAKYIGIYSLGVYLSLCRHSNKEQKSWPSIGKIAEELNISIPMVHGAIWTLETLNIIKKRRVGKMTCNRYWLLDKKEWISLTVEAVDKLISDINPVNITYKRRLH